MKITIEVVGSVFRVEIDNQPETVNGTAPSSEVYEGQGAQERTPGSEARSEDSASPLQRSSGVIATLPDSLQAKPDNSHRAGENSDGGLNIVTKHTEIAEPAPASKVSVLRPHCKHKDACGGFGFNPCHSCLRGANAEGSAA